MIMQETLQARLTDQKSISDYKMAKTLIITEKNIQDYSGEIGSMVAIEQIRAIVDDFVQSRSIGDAYYFSNKLQKILKETKIPNDILKIYQDFLLLLNFIAFPLLEDSAQKDLLSHHLLFSQKHEIDLKDRIHFVFFPYFRGKRDREKLTGLLRAIENNDEKIGNLKINILGEEQVEPTIKNWISDYRASDKTNRGGALSIALYFSNGRNPQALPEDDQNLLQNIIIFYDWLRFKAVPEAMLNLDLEKEIKTDELSQMNNQAQMLSTGLVAKKIQSSMLTKFIPEVEVTKRKGFESSTQPIHKTLPSPPRPVRRPPAPAPTPTSTPAPAPAPRPVEHLIKGTPYTSVPKVILPKIPTKMNIPQASKPVSMPKPVPPSKSPISLPKELLEEERLPESKQYVRRTTPLNEELYRSTLEQLSKIREAERAMRPETMNERLSDSGLEAEAQERAAKRILEQSASAQQKELPKQPAPAEKLPEPASVPPPSTPPSAPAKPLPSPEPLPSSIKSINEAIMNAGNATAVSDQDKKIVEDKLKELEDKLGKQGS